MKVSFVSIFNSVDSSVFVYSLCYICSSCRFRIDRVCSAHCACTPRVQNAVCLPRSQNAAFKSCHPLWTAEALSKHRRIKIARFWLCLYQYSLKQRHESLINQLLESSLAMLAGNGRWFVKMSSRSPRCCLLI